MISQEIIFNLALNALLLQRRITNAQTDQSNEAKVLLTNWDIAFQTTLEDMDLNRTATQVNLSLVATCPIHHWKYAYQYPVDCAFFRRIQSHVRMDSNYTHIPKIIGQFNGQTAIFTNKDLAIGEYISFNVPLSALSASAAQTVAYRLAMMASPLVTGKGALPLMTAIEKKYVMSKADAQAVDARENLNWVPEEIASDFVAVRTT